MRASWLSGIGLACVVGLAGCGEGTNPVEPGSLNGAGAAGGVSAAASSAAQNGADVNKGLAQIRQATTAFHDVDAAVLAGYMDPADGVCDSSPAGIMGIHAANPALIGDGAVDPLRPDVLLYLPTGGGNFRLIGVEYLQPVLVRNPATGAVAPWFAPDPWPSNYEIVNPTPSVLGQTFQGPMPGHVPGMPWHWDLHLWIWAPNPSGMFAQWNPRLSCPPGETH